MTDSKQLSADMVMAAYDANPDSFVWADYKNQRDTKKSANKYMDVNVTLASGKKRKLGFSWKMESLKGGIREPAERKDFPVTIQFRRSSGNLGEASYRIYERLRSQLTDGIASGVAKPKKSKQNFCTIVQTEIESTGEQLDDPIIRFKLPFDREGKPTFRLMKITNVNGKPKAIKVECTEANIHTIIKSRMLTSGYVSLDTEIFSGFGVSIPAKVQLLVIKDAEPDAPDPGEFMTEEEMLAMAGDADAVTTSGDVDDVNTGDVDDDTPTVEDGLAALQLAAAGGNDDDSE
jgi:hypothetical protein